MVADAFPNFSICGLPFYVSGETRDWRSLVPRGIPDLEVHDEWQVAERRYLSEASMAKLYETDKDGSDDKEVGTETKELLVG